MYARVILMVLAFLLMVPYAQAQTAPPPQDPILRIEAGMHTATIKFADVSRDGRTLVTASYDKTIRLWSVPDGRLIKTFRLPIGPGDGGKIYTLALSPDGRTVAAGGWDAAADPATASPSYIYLLDLISGAIIRRIGPAQNVINCLDFSPDGTRIAAGMGLSNGVKVWDTNTGALIAEDRTVQDVNGLAFGPTGMLAITSFAGYVRLYGTSLHQIATLTTQGGKQPLGVAFSPDGRKLAISYYDTSAVEVYDGTTLNRLYAADTSGVGDNLGSVAWSADGQSLFAGGRYSVRVDGRWRFPVVRWDREGQGPLQILPGSQNSIMSLRPWGKKGIVFGAYDPAFGLIDDDSKLVLYRGAPSVDMREKLGDSFRVSANAQQVRFTLARAQDPWLIDVAKGRFAPSEPAKNLVTPNIDGLAVTGWRDGFAPKLNGNPLPFQANERCRSLAVLPSKDGFILGSNWTLRRFDTKGAKVWEKPVPGAAWGVNVSPDGRLVVAAYDDGTIRWHRASDGTELLAFYVELPQDPNAPKRWVLWTPKGYYMASPGGEDLIGWHVNHGSWDQAPDFFPASRFREQFYRPDIVKRVLDTLDEEKAVEEANAASNRSKADENIRNKQPPVVTIMNLHDRDTITSPHLTVEYSVRSPSRLPIKRIKALVDGREVNATKGFIPMPANNSGDVLGSLTLDLPPHDVTLAILAETDDGASSSPSPISLIWGGARGTADPAQALATTGNDSAVKPRLYALLIGVAKYKDPAIPSLDFAAKDARDMASVLSPQKGRLYSDVEVKVLTDADATEKAIRKGLGWLARAPAQGDVAILFVSGHGFTDETGDYQFLPYDTEIQTTEFGKIPEDGTTVPHSEFRRALERAQRAHTFFLFDTCHAGQATGANFKSLPTNYAKFIGELTSAEAGVRVLASSEGEELSMESRNWQNGAFTKALVEALMGAADLDPKDGIITSDEINIYVTRRVQQLTGNRQHPVSQNAKFLRDIPVVAVAH